MSKKMLIDATHPEETRVVVVDGNKVEEFDFETVNKRQLQGNIYLAKVTRVEPSLQAAFVDYGGNRHGFLAFAEIHPDYYQIPVADRRALIEEERALARAEEDEESGRGRRKSAPRPAPAKAAQTAAVATGPADETAPETAPEAAPDAPAPISGMDVVDLGEETGADALVDAPAAVEPNGEAEEPWRAVDHASDTDAEIESVAEEDVAEEISAPRKQRSRRYKIQEVIKVRQIMLVQVVKEERGNKGAALTTYLSLAGRYCVLMPNTARGGGISRKITNAADRKKLKEIAGEIQVPEGAGLIVRTAGAKRTKAEIVRDYEYLMRLWEEVRELTLKSIAPAPIYEEGNLIKRTIRDLYSREIDEILVEGEAGFRTAKDFMRMIMPAHAKAVQLYAEPMPLFARFQVESYLASMFSPVVQLKSGGYIVIGVTEALVAIDVNSGRATKEGNIEDTALKTNLEAADEIARQLRLRDLAGLIVIDFIDMEDRRNNAAVEKRLKDRLKTDRARIQVGRISGFGLLEMSRQRLRPGMLESTTQPCPHCHGTGLIRSDESMALTVLRAIEEEGTRKRSREVLVRAPVGIVNYLINHKREHLALIEARYGMAVRLEADAKLISPDYSLEKFKTATRTLVERPAPTVISGNASLMGEAVDEELDDDLTEEAEEAAETVEGAEAADGGAAGEGGSGKKKKRRRRRRRGSGNGTRPGEGTAAAPGGEEEDEGEDEADEQSEDPVGADGGSAPVPSDTPVAAEATPDATAGETVAAEAAAPATKSRSSSRSRSSKAKAKPEPKAEPTTAAEPAPDAVPAAEKPKSSRARSGSSKSATAAKKAAAATAAAEPAEEAVPATEAAGALAAAEPPATFPADPGEADVPPATLSPDPGLAEAPAAEAAPGASAEAKPRKRGWWSLGR